MRDRKRILELRSLWDHTGLERHLAEMAERGWLLEKIGTFAWSYRRVEPRRLTFCVSYYPKASAFDPGPTEEQEDFYALCRHAGWELAAASAQLQVFYNERENPVPIDTDPVLEVETIHQTVKRSLLPSQLALVLLAVVNGGLFVSGALGDPIGTLSSASRLFTGLCWAELLVLSLSEIIGYCRWRGKARAAAERGEFLATKSRVGLQIFSLAVLGLGLLYYFLSVFTSGDRVMMVVAPLMFLWMAALFLLVRAIRDGLKRKKASRGINRAVTFGAAFVLAYAMVGLIILGTLVGMENGWFAGEEDTYQYRGQTFSAPQDPLPLTVEELLGVAYDGYIREQSSRQSFLLAQYEARQRARFDAADYKEMPRLEYTVTLVKLPALYGLCREALLKEGDGEGIWENRRYVSQEAEPWGAAEAYRLWDDEYGPWDEYLLCYPDRLVELHLDWEPTAEQMAAVGERLGGGGHPFSF